MQRSRHLSLSGLVVTLLLSACGASASAPASSPASSPAAASASQAGASLSAAPAKASPAASAQAGSASASGSAAPMTKLVVSFSNIIATELPIWEAKEAGIFAKNGLDVDVQNIDSSKGIAALLSGELQVANLGGPETMSAVVEGADLVTTSCEGPLYPFVFQVPASIKTIDDLKGKKVGVSSIGSVSDIGARLALQKEGLDPEKDVTIIAVGSLTNRIAALEGGAIQGGLANPPDTLALEAKGFHTLFDLSQMGLPASIASDVWQRSYVAAHHDVVQKYVDSIVQAIAYAKKNKAATITIMKKYFKSDDDHAMDVTYDYFTGKILPALPYPKPEQYDAAKQVLSQKNAKLKTFDVAKMLDDSFVKSAGDRGLDK